MLFSKIMEIFRNNHSEDIHRLIAAFPSELCEDVKESAKVIPFARNPIKLADGNEHFVDKFVSDYKPQTFNLRGEVVKIPYRVYFEQPEQDELMTLNTRQRTIINCIYLRHHNGFVREKHLVSLLEIEDYFALPFAIQILGEYVIELIFILDQGISERNISRYAELLSDNRFFWKQTQSRIVSYWDAYYRREFPKLRDYVGQRLSNRLNAVLRDLG
jgi:hypothetical protein